MRLYITVATLAVPLAAVSALLALTLLWQMRRYFRLQQTGRLGDESVLPLFSAWLSVGNAVLLVCGLYLVMQSVRFGINPDLMNPQIQMCLPPPPQGPGYPCDPSSNALQAGYEVQAMRGLLVVAPICWALSVVMLIAGGRAVKRSGQEGATQSE